MSTTDLHQEPTSPAGSAPLLIFDAAMIEARDHFRARLSGVERTAASVPLDGPRIAGERDLCRREIIDLPAPVVERLVRLTGDNAFLSYAALTAGVIVCLHRYGDADVVIGSPARASASRAPAPRNAIAVRRRVTGGATFKQILLDVRKDLLDAYARQTYPFAQLVADLDLDASAARCPLFDVAVAMKGLHAEMPPLSHDLTLTFERTASGVLLAIDHDPRLHRASTIARLARHLSRLLDQALSDPGRRVADLSPLDDDELRELTLEWSRPAADLTDPRSFVEIFERHADELPAGAVALAHGDRALTYRELDARSNQAARRFKELGVGPDVRVGVCLERSIDVVIALLGVLKAGGAYVPLDPDYPIDRLAFMQRDAALSVLVTELRLLDRLGAGAGVKVVCLDRADDREAMERCSQERLGPAAPEGALAYVIYTSGSTGRPKGVMITRRDLVLLGLAQVELFRVERDSRVLQFAPLSFDASISEIAHALLAGARLCLAGRDELMPGPDLEATAARHGVTHLTLPPTALAAMRDGALSSCEVLIVAGEACPAEVAERWSKGRRFINAYGPTETTVCATADAEGGAAAASSIGRPIPGARVYLLDRYLSPVPVGAPGEIYIGGAMLARGYLARPALSAERFLPDPFSPEPGARMYRTGDLGRFREDRRVEFLGRADHQVKIRGHRIELGEIEARLLEHEAVEQAAVVARALRGAEDDQALVMYVVARGPLDPGAVEEHLRRSLPDYMVPRLLVRLDRLPLSPAGKVDRAALPPPSLAGRRAAAAPPRDALEAHLAAIWRDVLRVDEVGIKDSFFELGGQSLKATQVTSRIHKELSVQIGWAAIFAHPTIEALAELVRGQRTAAFTSIPRAPEAEHHEASSAQRRMWILHRMTPDAGVYNVTDVSEARGAIDVDALRSALAALLRRHETLRTTFIEVDGEPRQVIHAEGSWPLEIVDLTGIDGDAAARDLVAAEARAPFDLERGPLVRAKVYRLGDERCLLQISMHHIVCDGWSMEVLGREARALYAAHLAGDHRADALLPPLAIQYKDYARWQNLRLAGPEGQRDREHHLAELRDPPPPLDVPADHPRPPVRTFAGAHATFTLDPADMASLEELGREVGASAFMACSALTAVLLHRYTGRTELMLGTPVAGRDHIELEGQVGFYVNTLALRARVDGGRGFSDVLAAHAERVKEAYAHQGYPFDRLVDELALRRDPGRSPIFDVVVTLNQPAQQAELAGAAMAPFDLPTTTSKFDLTFTFHRDDAGRWTLRIEYSTDLFEPDRIDRMAGHLMELARSAARDPDRPVGLLMIMGEAERRRVLLDFNATASDYPADSSLASRFTEQVRRYPERPAVLCQGRALTYAELDARSSALARALRDEHGVRRGDAVGLLLERSERVPVALLGILKAGAAYLAMESGWPSSRRALMLEDTGCRIVLTEPETLEKLPDQERSSPSARYVDITSVNGAPAAAPSVEIGGGDIAYIAYTSGSTGTPKGAFIPQRAVLRLVVNTNYVHIQPDDRFLSAGSVSFDASTFDIWGALLNGACVHFAPESVLLDPEALRALFLRERITMTFLTASLFNQLAEVDPSMFRHFRVLLCGGEKLSAPHCRRALDACPDLTLLNGYGPTENTTFSACYPVRDARGPDIPLGAPIANSTAYVLDPRGEPCPIGIPGELCTGGDGVALGYVRRPALTADRFRPSPLGDGQRLYRTGDLVAWSPEGRLLFFGRMDHQLKVRGFRVEPGEIEARLLQHPAIAAAAVVPWKNAVGALDLVAHYVPRSAVEADELRAFLAAALPKYMVPAHYMAHRALPLNPNGKVDRAALPAPGAAQRAAEPAPPRDDAERALVAAFSGVLGGAAFGVTDNLFEHGNDSIKSIQVVSRLGRMGYRLSVRDIFQYPTVAELARRLSRADEPAAPREAASGVVPLTPIQRWFFERYGASANHFNQDVLLRTEVRIDPAALREAVIALLSHHDAFRLRYTPGPDGAVTQAYAPSAGEPALDVVDLRDAPDPAAALTSHAAAAQRGLDLARGPLLRAAHYLLPDGDRIHLIAHHILIDGVSWRILLEDLQLALRQRMEGRSIDLGPAGASFQQWAHALTDWAALPGRDAELAYWSAADRAAAQAPRLPLLPPSSPPSSPETRLNKMAGSRTATVKLPAPTTRALLSSANHAYHTEAYDLLLVAFGRALASLGAGPRCALTLEGHGREPLPGAASPDITRTIGWFTSAFPFVLDVSDSDISRQIQRVKEARRAVPHRGIGHGVLRWLAPEGRCLDRSSPGPSISFNYLGELGEGSGASLFLPGREPTGDLMAPDMERDHILDVSAVVVEGRLGIGITYPASHYKGGEIEALAAAFEREIEALAAHCEGRPAARTPSDFTGCPLSLEDYDAFLAESGLDPRDIEDIYPLSPLQQGLLVEALLDPGSVAYHVQIVYLISGDLSPEQFCESWDALVRRHPVLRTAFFHRGLPAPLQVVLRCRLPEFTFEDLSDLPPDAIAARIAQAREQDRARGFDFEREPLLRVALFREGERRYRAVWSYHHALLDGWSLGAVYRDLARHYVGDPPTRPAVPYKDYIRWLQGRDRGAAAAHFAALLDGYDRPAGIPRTAPPGAARSGALHEHAFELGPESSARLARLTAELGVTQSTFVRAVWSIVLARHNDRDDVVFGAVVAGRPADLDGVEEIVGPFINTIPVRARVEDHRSLTDLLAELQRQSIDGEPHHHLTLAEIQAQSPLGRELFDHLLVFENYPVDPGLSDPAGDPLEITPEEAHDRTHYPLNLVVIPGDRLRLRLTVDTAHHTREQAERLAAQWLSTCEQALADPGRLLGSFNVLPDAERALVTELFARGPALPLGDRTVPELFEDQARRTPDHIAVAPLPLPGAAPSQAMTYRELESRTGQLALRLTRDHGVGPEAHVALLLPPCAEAIVAVLGVLRSGGSYLPLDPSHPADRLRETLDDAGCSLCITISRHADKARQAGAAHVLEIDVPPGLALQPDGAAETFKRSAPLSPRSRAYTIYTSGSTGKPKGCEIEHKNLSHYIDWAARYLERGLDAPRFALFSSIAFDFTVMTQLLPLTRGGSVAVPPGHADADLPDLLRAVFHPENHIDAVEITPSHLSMLAELGLGTTCVKLAIVGGEALSLPQIRALAGLNPEMAIHNEYGPTEATVGCIVTRVSPDDSRVVIGKPIGRAQIYLLDRAMRPVPVEAPGEIFIGGAGVARGYLRRPELTRERFVPSPFAEGERLYRTGDLARWLPDGAVDYLGRNDGQIKVRGHRVEIGEIERRLLDHPDVVLAAVVAAPVEGRPELVAYVQGGPAATAAELRGSLAKTLPEAMIPSRFVLLDALPLNAIGKVDKRRLPPPGAAPSTGPGDSPPRTAAERALQKIWTEVLGAPVRSIREPFFLVGGHSLRAMQVVSRVQKELGVSLRLRDLFERQTIAELGELIDSAAAGGKLAGREIPPAPPQDHHELSDAQRRLWLVHRMKGERAYNMPESITLEGDLDVSAVRRAFNALIDRHEALRTAFIEVSGEPRQQILPRVDFDVVEIDLRSSPDAQARADELAAREALAPFDLTAPPLLRATLLRLGERRYQFLFTMHHIIGDGWSMLVLKGEFLRLYDAFHRGLPSPLEPLRIQYKDFAAWQNARDFRESIRYFRDRLAGIGTSLPLPYDAPPALEREFRGGACAASLPEPALRGLQRLAARLGTTTATVTLSLFLLFLSRLTGRQDVWVGMGIAGRGHRDIENLIGFFVNMLPVRARVTEDMDLSDLIRQVAAEVEGALEHQDCPMDLLVQELNPTRRANRQPLFNVAYTFQNFLDVRAGGAEGLALAQDQIRSEARDTAARTAKFDLTLFASEVRGRLELVLEYDAHLFHEETARGYLAAIEEFATLAAGAGDADGDGL